MIRRRIDSKIEIWGENYINNRLIRTEEDRDLEIEQIEPCGGCDYIVEVYKRREAEQEGEG